MLDASSFDVIANAFSRAQPRVADDPFFAVRYAGVVLDDDTPPTDEQRAKLKDDFTALVSYSFLETIRSLEFGNELPPVGARHLVPFAPGGDPFAQISRVALISAISDQLEMKAIGFGHEEEFLPVSAWNLDEMLEAQLSEMIADRFTVVDVEIDRSQLFDKKIYDDDGLRKTYPELPENPQIDAYIVLFKHPQALFNMSWNRFDGYGIGVFRQRSFEGGDTTVFAHYAIAVIDANTRELIRIAEASTSPAFAKPYSLPIDNALWVEETTEVTPCTRQHIAKR